jgi:hypothetical protein
VFGQLLERPPIADGIGPQDAQSDEALEGSEAGCQARVRRGAAGLQVLEQAGADAAESEAWSVRGWEDDRPDRA